MIIFFLSVLLVLLVGLSWMYRRDRHHLKESVRESMRSELLDEANHEIEDEKRRKELFRDTLRRANRE